MFIVTGAAGFIGANNVKFLNEQGVEDILIVDDMTTGDKIKNINDLRFCDFMDLNEFRQLIETDQLEGNIDAIFHQGACSDTMESDGKYMMDNNFSYSKSLFHFATKREIPFIYASSASVYGNSTTFVEDQANEQPLNVYAFSKWLFDRYVKSHLDGVTSTVVGLRYFNVYGPREQHKGRMMSMVNQLTRQVYENDVAKLFEGTEGYADGAQERDFVYVGDLCKINWFFAKGDPVQGVFNAGTGVARSFNAIAEAAIALKGSGHIEYLPFPDSLKGKYQSYTCADLTQLRAAGYQDSFTSLEDGVRICAQAAGYLGD